MHPILFEWGPIRIGFYGLFLTLAFSAAILITNREFRKNSLDVALAWDIYLLAIIGGLVGSRLLYILENTDQFYKTPVKLIFSVSGFSVIGGYLLAIALCAVRIRMVGEPFLKIADVTSPGLAVGYAVGRLGCIVAGDGCYGLPSNVWCAMHFPNGLVSTLSAKNPFLVSKFLEKFPGIPVPADIPVHPTPLYESISHFILLAILLNSRWKIGPDPHDGGSVAKVPGQDAGGVSAGPATGSGAFSPARHAFSRSGRRFAFFLAWFGISRFFVEFIRLNPASWLGFTSDQWLSFFLLAVSVLIVFFRSRFSSN